MMYAARILNHSKKLQQTHNFLRDRAISVCWFRNDARPSIDKIVGKLQEWHSKVGIGPGGKNGIPKFFNRDCFSPNHRAVNGSMISAVGMNKGNALWMARKVHAPAVGTQYNRFSQSFSHISFCTVLNMSVSSQPPSSFRSFSTDSGLPPHQEIGMPSLSPTTTEGNIARWLKKEGDKVSPGEVLCEVETDKATVEMECMEEGYLAKILRGDGSSGIKVGEIIAITVEEEDDISIFKDYSPSTASALAPAPAPSATPKEPSAPSPPKQKVAEVPVTLPEPKVSRPSSPSSAGDLIFASPLAGKLAEDNKISFSEIKGTSPEGRLVKADIEDYLAACGKEVSQASKVDTTISAALDCADIPHSQIRKVTASRLLQSKQTIPHYYLGVDKLMELRSQPNSLQEVSGGKRIYVNDLVIKV